MASCTSEAAKSPTGQDSQYDLATITLFRSAVHFLAVGCTPWNVQRGTCNAVIPIRWSQGFRTYVIDDPIHPLHFINDAIGDAREHVRANAYQSAVIPSRLVTARNATT